MAFPEADIEAVVDYEGAESAEGDVRIIVRDEFATPAAMLAYEDDVRSLVRSAEIGETMLYTTVERSDGD